VKRRVRDRLGQQYQRQHQLEISGNINSSGIGVINNQSVVITKNRYEDVYGTGLNLRFGGGYMLSDVTEVRGTFTFQSLDADLTPMGEYGAARLYGQYSDYQAFSLDVGLRRYRGMSPTVQVYGEGQIGLGFVDKTDVTLVAPAANLFRDANDFYDQTTAFTFGVNGGVLFNTGRRTGIFVQAGLRWVSGMSEIDDLEGTGLETINDKSARWTFRSSSAPGFDSSAIPDAVERYGGDREHMGQIKRGWRQSNPAPRAHLYLAPSTSTGISVE
jgi:hypothetical protein